VFDDLQSFLPEVGYQRARQFETFG
jgi:hypothetical protein